MKESRTKQYGNPKCSPKWNNANSKKKKISDFFPLISLVLSLSLLFFLLFFSSFICVSLVPPFFLLSPLSFWLLYQAQRSLCTSLGKRWCTMISVQTCYKLATNQTWYEYGTLIEHGHTHSHLLIPLVFFYIMQHCMTKFRQNFVLHIIKNQMENMLLSKRRQFYLIFLDTF